MNRPRRDRPKAPARPAGQPGAPRIEKRSPERASESLDQAVFGVHPVLELLEARPRSIERIVCARERQRGMGRLLREARERGVPVTFLPRDVMARRLGKAAVHQGVAATVGAVAYADPAEVCRAAAARTDARLVVVDGIEDPRNLGAAIRTCAGAGVSGVILGTEGTVGLTPAAVKTSAGTVERIPVARHPKVPGLLKELKELGFTSIGLTPHATTSWDATDLSGRIVLVAGGESRGLRPGVARACDRLVAIPLEGGVESLNVAVALGVLLFEALRQRRAPEARS